MAWTNSGPRSRRRGLQRLDVDDRCVSIGDDTRGLPASAVAQYESGRRIADHETQVLNRMRGNERHYDCAGLEDSEPGGKRRRAALQTQRDPFTRLDPGFQ